MRRYTDGIRRRVWDIRVHITGLRINSHRVQVTAIFYQFFYPKLQRSGADRSYVLFKATN